MLSCRLTLIALSGNLSATHPPLEFHDKCWSGPTLRPTVVLAFVYNIQ